MNPTTYPTPATKVQSTGSASTSSVVGKTQSSTDDSHNIRSTVAPTTTTTTTSLGSRHKNKSSKRHPRARSHPFLNRLLKSVSAEQRAMQENQRTMPANSMATTTAQGLPNGPVLHRPLPYSAPSTQSGEKQGEVMSSNANNSLTNSSEPPFAPPSHDPHHGTVLNDPETTGNHHAVETPAVYQTSHSNLDPHDAGPSAAMTELLKARSHLKPGNQEVIPSRGEVAGQRGGSSLPRSRKRARHSPTSSPRKSRASRSQVLGGSRQTALKRPRGRPRTRYHPSVGHPGVSRGQEKGKSRSESPITISSSTSRRSSQDSRAASRTHRSTLEPPSCQECPETWPTGTNFDFWRSSSYNQERTIHSAPVRPCSNAAAHADGPYHVCASCRAKASTHRVTHYSRLLSRPKLLPLCGRCSTSRLESVAKAEDLENGKLKRVGCVCNLAWLCFACGLQELEDTKISYDAEREFRRGIVGVGVDGKTPCAYIGNLCVCGGSLSGTEQTWRCAGCRAIVVLQR
ncbi:MAG: hypothetical protein Q9222_003266 [Ikaeria aurantiellina]